MSRLFCEFLARSRTFSSDARSARRDAVRNSRNSSCTRIGIYEFLENTRLARMENCENARTASCPRMENCENARTASCPRMKISSRKRDETRKLRGFEL